MIQPSFVRIRRINSLLSIIPGVFTFEPPPKNKKLKFGKVSCRMTSKMEPYSNMVVNAACKINGIKGGCLVTDLSRIDHFFPLMEPDEKNMGRLRDALGVDVGPGEYVWVVAERLKRKAASGYHCKPARRRRT
jgi:hypothetical protein